MMAEEMNRVHVFGFIQGCMNVCVCVCVRMGDSSQRPAVATADTACSLVHL